MFVRKKKNKSGVVSVQVIDKSTGSYKLLQTIGSSSDPKEIEDLFIKGKEWISKKIGQLSLNFEQENSKTIASKIQSINASGISILIESIYNAIGFDKLSTELLLLLVIARLSNPVSKLQTIDYLYKYHSISIKKDKIYRYLDKLY